MSDSTVRSLDFGEEERLASTKFPEGEDVILDPLSDSPLELYAPDQARYHHRSRPFSRLLVTMFGIVAFLTLGVTMYNSHSLWDSQQQGLADTRLLQQIQANTHRDPPPPLSPEESQRQLLQNKTDHTEQVFGHAYMINLAKRYDRRDYMVDLMRYLDIPVEFSDGTTPDMINFVPAATKESSLDDSTLACWRSHMHIYQDIVTNGYPRALIMEDDIDLTQDVTDRVEEYLNHLPDNWDMFYLGHCSVGYYVGPMYDTAHGIRILRGPWCTHGYMVSFRGAAKLLRLLRAPTQAIDASIADLTGQGHLYAFAAEPRLVAQIRSSDNPSDIANSSDTLLWNELESSARQAMEEWLETGNSTTLMPLDPPEPSPSDQVVDTTVAVAVAVPTDAVAAVVDLEVMPDDAS
ncbi:hypothetical protein H4R33_006338 [Dimargaris cristalligena]|uniref:Glycosyl transferase family 25 domain-containing protein n=1 Tax=Dimargaris cristalligena TaxID=215637 RepID=A0A4P9ZQB2_9FUNG|nr:hypothetical protein H4R33_006338 [Dimargaris cristalligena]RKP34911.1 hypothetical protein BJ085DRAFT_33472 [Dimargaris cristalligena]|eukprot:RKP34911.1 hypothetical protein BJ085DRAFT_33472 [Dimargaris cristalligena]